MRAIILILIVAVVAIILAVATGLVDINQTRPARAPDIDTTGNGLTASGGQTPAFDIETGSVTVGANPQEVTVPVPTVNVNPADDPNAANTATPPPPPPANSQ